MKRVWDACKLLMAGIGAVTAAGCSGSKAASTSADLPTVAVSVVVRDDIRQVLNVAAEFRPFQEIDVHSKVAGFLKRITVDVGDRVGEGQLLAVLEIPEVENDLQQGEAAIRRAEEEVKRAQADLERTESGHEVAHVG